MSRLLEAPPPTGQASFPAATAMVWQGVGRGHLAVAVPGVRLAPGDALVAVELATVCGSDLRTVRGDRQASTPLVLGHEQVGTVVDVARGAKTSSGAKLGIGDRVVWSQTVSCGRCIRCRRGLPQLCLTVQRYGHERMRRGWELSGGFATHVHVRAGTAIVPVPSTVPAEVLAPLSCAGGTAVAALDAACDVVTLCDEVVIVSGAGMLGLIITALAKRAGARVVVSEPRAERRDLALAFGADAVTEPASASRSGSLKSALHRMGRRGDTVRIAIEASGAGTAVRELVESVDAGGVVVLAGSSVPDGELVVEPAALTSRMLTLRGVDHYTSGQLERAVDFAVECWQSVPLAAQVGRVFGLADASEALAAAAGGASPRVAVAPFPRLA
ncbi:alcohol dehydrogenase catalytic domain-containing protein [Rathayibacter sp. CAU 1779]